MPSIVDARLRVAQFRNPRSDLQFKGGGASHSFLEIKDQISGGGPTALLCGGPTALLCGGPTALLCGGPTALLCGEDPRHPLAPKWLMFER